MGHLGVDGGCWNPLSFPIVVIKPSKSLGLFDRGDQAIRSLEIYNDIVDSRNRYSVSEEQASKMS